MSHQVKIKRSYVFMPMAESAENVKIVVTFFEAAFLAFRDS
jgi:hypothetical protein